MEETVLTVTLLVVVILLGWSLVGSGPALSKSFQRLGRMVPKKEGWRARWGIQGPLPRDYRGRNIWESYAVLADEGVWSFW